MELKNIDSSDLQDELATIEEKIRCIEEQLEEAKDEKCDLEAEIEKSEGEN